MFCIKIKRVPINKIPENTNPKISSCFNKSHSYSSTMILKFRFKNHPPLLLITGYLTLHESLYHHYIFLSLTIYFTIPNLKINYGYIERKIFYNKKKKLFMN